MDHYVRPATPADRPLVLSLLREYLPDLDSDARHRWLYERNPHGAGLTWLAFDAASDEPAGMTSFFPRRLWIGDREVRGALGGDGYVRPRFRRRGIGESLHRASQNDMPAHQIEVMFGTPMPANVTPLRKVGGEDVTFVVEVARLLPGLLLGGAGGRLLARATRRRGGLEPIVGADPRVDRLWEAMREEVGPATVRDASFYAWRFAGTPRGRQRGFVVMDHGEPVGACALEHQGRHAFIVDLVASRTTVHRALDRIAAAVAGQRTLRMKLPRPLYHRWELAAAGFIPRSATRPLNLVYPRNPVNLERYRDPLRWFFTWADTDQDAL